MDTVNTIRSQIVLMTSILKCINRMDNIQTSGDVNYYEELKHLLAETADLSVYADKVNKKVFELACDFTVEG